MIGITGKSTLKTDSISRCGWTIHRTWPSPRRSKLNRHTSLENSRHYMTLSFTHQERKHIVSDDTIHDSEMTFTIIQDIIKNYHQKN